MIRQVCTEEMNESEPLMLRPAIFKVIGPFLFEVRQCSLSRAIIGRTHTEDSTRQKTGF